MPALREILHSPSKAYILPELDAFQKKYRHDDRLELTPEDFDVDSAKRLASLLHEEGLQNNSRDSHLALRALFNTLLVVAQCSEMTENVLSDPEAEIVPTLKNLWIHTSEHGSSYNLERLNVIRNGVLLAVDQLSESPNGRKMLTHSSSGMIEAGLRMLRELDVRNSDMEIFRHIAQSLSMLLLSDENAEINDKSKYLSQLTEVMLKSGDFSLQSVLMGCLFKLLKSASPHDIEEYKERYSHLHEKLRSFSVRNSDSRDFVESLVIDMNNDSDTIQTDARVFSFKIAEQNGINIICPSISKDNTTWECSFVHFGLQSLCFEAKIPGQKVRYLQILKSFHEFFSNCVEKTRLLVDIHYGKLGSFAGSRKKKRCTITLLDDIMALEEVHVSSDPSSKIIISFEEASDIDMVKQIIQERVKATRERLGIVEGAATITKQRSKVSVAISDIKFDETNSRVQESDVNIVKENSSDENLQSDKEVEKSRSPERENVSKFSDAKKEEIKGNLSKITKSLNEILSSEDDSKDTPKNSIPPKTKERNTDTCARKPRSTRSSSNRKAGKKSDKTAASKTTISNARRRGRGRGGRKSLKRQRGGKQRDSKKSQSKEVEILMNIASDSATSDDQPEADTGQSNKRRRLISNTDSVSRQLFPISKNRHDERGSKNEEPISPIQSSMTEIPLLTELTDCEVDSFHALRDRLASSPMNLSQLSDAESEMVQGRLNDTTRWKGTRWEPLLNHVMGLVDEARKDNKGRLEKLKVEAIESIQRRIEVAKEQLNEKNQSLMTGTKRKMEELEAERKERTKKLRKLSKTLEKEFDCFNEGESRYKAEVSNLTREVSRRIKQISEEKMNETEGIRAFGETQCRNLERKLKREYERSDPYSVLRRFFLSDKG